jgi:hypothetical protein
MKTLRANTPNGTPTIGAVILISQLGLIGISLKKVRYHSRSDLWDSIDLPVALILSGQQNMRALLARVCERI